VERVKNRVSAEQSGERALQKNDGAERRAAGHGAGTAEAGLQK